MKDSTKILEKLIVKNDQILAKDGDASELFSAVSASAKRYACVVRTEDTSHDIKWIDVIEEAIPSIQKIVDNPKKFIKSTSYLVKAELAKKTGPESVVHLATHSQYVKKIDDNGDVIPSKVLTSESEEDIAIYENRFLMTLIKRLNLYVEKRYIFAKKFASLTNSTILYVDNSYKFGDMEITQTSTITMKTPVSEELKVEASNVLSRVEMVRKIVSSFMGGKFMKELRSAKPIHPPIMQTNILRKNPEYRKAYQLWTFLGEEERTNMNFLVNEDIKSLNKEEEKRIDFINYVQVLDILNGKNLKTLRFTKRKYAVKVLKSIDEKLYLNDKFKEFELVRADEQYYEDIRKKEEVKIKDISPKVKRKVFDKENEKIRKIDIEKKAAEALMKRKRKEEALLEARKLREEEKEKKRLEQLRIKEEKDRIKESINEIERMRREIQKEAIANADDDANKKDIE